MPFGATPAESIGPELPEETDAELWQQLTERVELPMPEQAFSGLGSFQTLTFERLGIIAEAMIRVQVHCKAKTAVKFAAGLPYRLLKNLSLQANGVSGVISCSGTLLQSRATMVYRGPNAAVLQGAVEPGVEHALGTEFTFEFILPVPIAEDLSASLDGAALAQSEETQLALQLTWASAGEILETGELEAVTGAVGWMVTWFTIGTAQTKKGRRVVVLPNLSELHGLIERETEINPAAGEKEAPLTRAAGDLLRYWASLRNGPHATVDPLTWTRFALRYGGNQTPINYQLVAFLVERNTRDYRVRPDVNGVHYVVVDTTLDDALRDAIRPMGLSELRSIIGAPALESGSAVVTAQENLYPQGT
jgi:hypothetical protein